MKVENLQALSLGLKESLHLPEKYPFPYIPENFSPDEEKVLLHFFTNVDKPVFAVFGLPQEVVGALFSRYSRYDKSVRRCFLDEFWKSPELGIQNLTTYLASEGEELEGAKTRASKFYARVYAEYGDKSVIQMGSVHLSFEFVSQIAAKAIEDIRLAAFIEKSTRYVEFWELYQNMHFLFSEPPEIMRSKFGPEFIAWNTTLFTAYKKHIPTTVEYLRRKYPIDQIEFQNPKTEEVVSFKQIEDEREIKKAKAAYERALKAKALDTIRVFLPTTTVTNLGAHLSGQSAEHLVNKLLASEHAEVRLLGAMALSELQKIAPSFLLHVDHKYGGIERDYLKSVREMHRTVSVKCLTEIEEEKGRSKVRVVDWDPEADINIAAQILYKFQDKTRFSKASIKKWARKIKDEDLEKYPSLSWSTRLAEVIIDSTPNRKLSGYTREQKLPRAFEHAFAEVEFNQDFGIYRDLQRNRMSTTERLRLSAQEIAVPEEFYEPGMEAVLKDYLKLAAWTKDLNYRLENDSDPEVSKASEYGTILGNRLRFNVRANVRQWAFFAELRTIAPGHKLYRWAMQNAVRQVLYVYPFLKPLFAHVNWKKDYGLGRLKAEIKTQEKLAQLES